MITKTIFENWFSWDYHQERGSTHVDGRIDNLLNKESFPTTKLWEDSSMDALTPNMLPSSNWDSCTLVFVAHAWEIGLNQSNQIISNGIVTFKSYSKATQIASPHPK